MDENIQIPMFLRLDITNLVNMSLIRWIDFENRLVYFTEERPRPGIDDCGIISKSKLKEYRHYFEMLVECGQCHVFDSTK